MNRLPDRAGPNPPPFPTECPACAGPLDRRTTAGPGVAGVAVEVCERCLGVWLPPHGVRQIADPRASGALAGAFGIGLRHILRAIERTLYTDTLTGVRNRRAFDYRLATAIKDADDTFPVSVLFIDLDGFKELNDTKGHAAGDEALRDFARVLERQFRPMDHVARYGGDEFAVILPETDARAAQAAEVRVFRSLRYARLQSVVPLEASIGAATYPDDGATAAEIVRVADERMYLAKRAKRNGGDHGSGHGPANGGVVRITEPPDAIRLVPSGAPGSGAVPALAASAGEVLE